MYFFLLFILHFFLNAQNSPVLYTFYFLHMFSFPATFMNESDHCECPVPCEKIRYQPQLSYAQMPAKHYSEALAKLKHIDKDRMRHFLR